MILIGTGWRRWNGSKNRVVLQTALTSFWKLAGHGGEALQMVIGDATGADWEMLQWAEMMAMYVPPPEVFKADWNTYGKSAGPIRNSLMVARAKDLAVTTKEALMGIAFLHTESRGTVDCINQMRASGIYPLIVPWVHDPHQQAEDEIHDLQGR